MTENAKTLAMGIVFLLGIFINAIVLGKLIQMGRSRSRRQLLNQLRRDIDHTLRLDDEHELNLILKRALLLAHEKNLISRNDIENTLTSSLRKQYAIDAAYKYDA